MSIFIVGWEIPEHDLFDGLHRYYKHDCLQDMVQKFNKEFSDGGDGDVLMLHANKYYIALQKNQFSGNFSCMLPCVSDDQLLGPVEEMFNLDESDIMIYILDE